VTIPNVAPESPRPYQRLQQISGQPRSPTRGRRRALGFLGIACCGLLTGCQYLPTLDAVVPDERTKYQKAQTMDKLEIPPDLSGEGFQDRMAIPGGEIPRSPRKEQGYPGKDKDRLDPGVEQRPAPSGGDLAPPAPRPSGAGSEGLERHPSPSAGLEGARPAPASSAAAPATGGRLGHQEGEAVVHLEGAPKQIWIRVKTFWQKKGYDIQLDDAELGVMETKWREDPVRLVRDRFELHLEGDRPGTTLCHITHKAEELSAADWRPRAADPALARRMAEGLRTEIGAAVGPGAEPEPGGPPAAPHTQIGGHAPQIGAAGGKDAAAPGGSGGAARAEIQTSDEGRVYLSVPENFATAWHGTDTALRKAGFTIEESDRARGIFTFTAAPARGGGLWSRMAFWQSGETRQLSVTGVGAKTELAITDVEGKWDGSPLAADVLRRLQEVYLVSPQ
jgi:outer membrane protein assembly factor BamC